jgi:hypothetical protein
MAGSDYLSLLLKQENGRLQIRTLVVKNTAP